jgi:hypothetical protein
MKPFVTKLALYSFLIALADYSWNNFMPVENLVPKIWFIFSFFIVVTISFHFFILNAAKGRPQSFVTFYMGFTALRMVLCLIVIIAYRFIDKPNIIPFAVAFILHYFLFTIFEVTTLLRHFRK